MKDRNNKRKLLMIIIIVVIILFLSGIYYFLFMPRYKVVDKTKEMTETEKKYGDKVLSWVRVEGTGIDMPVIYRDTDTDVSKSDYDFAWSYTENKEKANHIVITSHNVLNVSSNPLKPNKSLRRFESLPAFLYSDFALKNQFIQYSIGEQNDLYRIFSVAIVKNATIDYDNNVYSKEKLKKYIDNSAKESYYNYDLDVNETDSILTLVTCTRFFGATTDYSIKIDARKVRKHEIVKPVKLRVQSNYDIILEKMKEGETYETTA